MYGGAFSRGRGGMGGRGGRPKVPPRNDMDKLIYYGSDNKFAV